MAKHASAGSRLPEPLAWLADAPLFIDEDQVGRFYDAVVQPEREGGTVTLDITKDVAVKAGGKIGLGAEASPSTLLKALTSWLPFLDVKGQVNAEAQAEGESSSSTSVKVELHPIKTPQRQLVQLALHYLINHEERLFLLGNEASSWPSAEAILAVPRALAFIDLVPGGQVIPAAAEFANGRILPLFQEFKGKKKGRQPKYPESGSPEELAKARKAYWRWFGENVTPTQAMVVVEKGASNNGRIRWIDYRVMLSEDGATLHLHVCPAEQYDTGVLAYNLVKRGHKHGLRLVGTLKSEPDLNVLAIYEK